MSTSDVDYLCLYKWIDCISSFETSRIQICIKVITKFMNKIPGHSKKIFE